jgi:hypothetical protein
MGQNMRLPRASLTGFHTALPILDLESLDLQIGALPENQLILAEPSILRLLDMWTAMVLGALLKK